MRRHYFLSLFVALGLSSLALYRTDFSLSHIRVPLSLQPSPPFSPDLERLAQQPFTFLGKGRQSYVFESADKQCVLKFFIRDYMELPWYSRWIRSEKEREKRRLRKEFYATSYALADRLLKKETGLLYVHLGLSQEELPSVQVVDRASRLFSVDLNQIPFILQRKGEPFFSVLQRLEAERGDEAVVAAMRAFFQLVDKRLELGIRDKDHDIEHNFASIGGEILQIDPGRWLEGGAFSRPEEKRHAWWAGTHQLRKWLEKKYPHLVPVFDAELERMVNKREIC